MDNELCRNLTESDLKSELDNLRACYMAIYDEYYETGSRDSAFLKDLVDSIKGIVACLDVYTRSNGINPLYVVDKLNYTINTINSVKEYYEWKIENDKKNQY